MSRSSPLQAPVVELSRRLGAQNVLRSAAIARRAGMHPTDLECLDVLLLSGPCTAGEIMAGTGLTSGAVTAMIDRLERRGFVFRTRDPADRRRVQVAVDQKAIRPVAALFRSGAERWSSVLAQFSQAELAVVERFLARALDTAIDMTAELRSSSARDSISRPSS